VRRSSTIKPKIQEKPMSNASNQGPKKASLFPPSRIAVIVLAIVAAIVFTHEFRIRGQCERTFRTIERALDGPQEGMAKADVKKAIEGNPSCEVDGNTELYVWSGIVQKYRIWVTYQGDHAVRVEQTARTAGPK
jgi:hypothetical protein